MCAKRESHLGKLVCIVSKTSSLSSMHQTGLVGLKSKVKEQAIRPELSVRAI